MQQKESTSTSNKEWFDIWFDSPYYHLLYKHRDEEEAKDFIDNLEKYLKFKPGERAMDLACGKGRHSIYLAKKKLDVTGLDLSVKNIQYASAFEHENLHFEVHDMRKHYNKGRFKYVFNLFTSFGYFEDPSDHQKVINAINKALVDNGYLVIDFLNPQVVMDQLVSAEEKSIDNINFKITRYVEEEAIIKNIHFEDDGQPYFFQERVKAITKTEFLSYFHASGMEVKDIFGDYYLTAYEEHSSPRMIFIVGRKH